MTRRLLALAAVTGFLAAPAALASDKFVVEFDYSPAEVATPEGAERAYGELESMIAEKCRPATADRRRASDYRLTRECVNRTLDDAVAQMDMPAVTRVHEARRG